MVLLCTRWQHATYGIPSGEARLLYFAGVPQPSNPDPASPENIPVPENREESEARKGIENSVVGEQQRGVRNEVQNIVGGDEEKNEKSNTLKAAEEISKQSRELSNAVDNLDIALNSDLLKNYMEREHLHTERSNVQAFIWKQQETLGKIQTVAEDIAAWEQGNLPIEQLADKVQIFYEYSDDEKWKEITEKLATYRAENAERIQKHGSLHEPEETQRTLDSWKGGGESVTPTKFVESIRVYYGENPTPEQQAVLDKLHAYVQRPDIQEKIQLWKGVNASDRLVIIAELNAIADIKAIEESIEENRKIRKEIAEIVRLEEILALFGADMAARTESAIKAENLFREQAGLSMQDQHGPHAHEAGFLGANVKFYSPLELWTALKEIKDAFMTAYHERSHHKSAELAKGIASVVDQKWIWLGTEVNVALKKKLEADNEKEKSEYKEYLKSNNPSFNELFVGPRSEMANNSKNPNKVRAVLEHGASRGWLYDLDLSAGKSAKTTLGFDLNHLMHDYNEHELLNYFDGLRSENSNGREHEIKHEHDKVQDIENIPFFIAEIEREMHHSNLWGAIGIAQRAIERGLYGETIPWVMTTITRSLREHPEVRKRASVQFYDKLGALSLYHSDSTMGAMKAYRNNFYKWSQTGDEKNFHTISTVTGVITEIEEEIRERTHMSFSDDDDGPNSKKALDRYVAKILACQPVEINGQKFSIFDDRYLHFTTQELGQGEIAVGKEDEDYYREITGNQRADAIVIKEIFAVTGSGQLKNDSRAIPYAKTMFSMPDKLIENGQPKAAENYRKIMGAKMTAWLSSWLSDSRSEPVAQVVINGRYFVKNLIEKGFVDIELVERAVRLNWGGAKLGVLILRQLNPLHPLLPENKKKEKPEATEPQPKPQETIENAQNTTRNQVAGVTGTNPPGSENYIG